MSSRVACAAPTDNPDALLNGYGNVTEYSGPDCYVKLLKPFSYVPCLPKS